MERASHSPSAAIEHMGVDHRRANVAVSKQLLDRPNVVAAFEKMGSEAYDR